VPRQWGIFAKRTGGAAAALFDATLETDKFSAALLDVTGISAEIAGVQLDTLAGQTKLLKSAFTGVVLEIGKALIPTLKELATGMAKAFGRMAAWTAAHPALTRAIVMLTGAIGIGLVAGGLVFALGKLNIAVVAVGTAIRWLTAHPIVALITIIAGLLTYTITEIIKHWDDFKWAIGEVGRVVAETFNKMKEAVGNFFVWIRDKIVGFVTGPWRWFQKNIISAVRPSWFVDAMSSMATASTVAFDTIGAGIRATISNLRYLRAASQVISSDLWSQWQAGGRGRMAQTRRTIRTMLRTGQMDVGDIQAEIAAVERERELGQAHQIGWQALGEINQYLRWLQTTISGFGEGGVTVNVENLTVENEDQAVAMGQSLYDLLATESAQGGSNLGFT